MRGRCRPALAFLRLFLALLKKARDPQVPYSSNRVCLSGWKLCLHLSSPEELLTFKQSVFGLKRGFPRRLETDLFPEDNKQPQQTDWLQGGPGSWSSRVGCCRKRLLMGPSSSEWRLSRGVGGQEADLSPCDTLLGLSASKKPPGPSPVSQLFREK